LKTRHTIKTSSLSLTMVGFLSACITLPFELPGIVTQAPITEAEVAVSVTSPEELAVVGFDRIRSKFPEGHLVGHYEGERLYVNNCFGYRGEIRWQAGPGFLEPAEFADIFYSEMKKANFNVSGANHEMFSGMKDDRAAPKFLISGDIDRLQLQVCDEADAWSGERLNRQSGRGTTEISWQLFDTFEREVIYKTSTIGSVTLPKAVLFGKEVLIKQAFAMAAANLTEDPKLISILKRKQRAPIISIKNIAKAP